MSTDLPPVAKELVAQRDEIPLVFALADKLGVGDFVKDYAEMDVPFVAPAALLRLTQQLDLFRSSCNSASLPGSDVRAEALTVAKLLISRLPDSSQSLDWLTVEVLNKSIERSADIIAKWQEAAFSPE